MVMNDEEADRYLAFLERLKSSKKCQRCGQASSHLLKLASGETVCESCMKHGEVATSIE